MDQMSTELASERSVSQKLENQKLALERQNKEMRDKLAELEGQSRARTKAIIAALESKVVNLEEQLEIEAKYGHSTVIVGSQWKTLTYSQYSHI